MHSQTQTEAVKKTSVLTAGSHRPESCPWFLSLTHAENVNDLF